jgi:phosphatidylglycerophosphate synthase
MPSRAQLRYLPNVISFSRLLLAAGFIIADTATRVVLVAVAAATDFLDGYIARRVNAATRWGALIDPIGDRAFVVVALTTFLVSGTLSAIGFVVMLSRDVMTAIGFLVARIIPWLRPVEFKARFAGKVATVLQLATLFALLLRPEWVPPLIVAVGIVSFWAIVDYTMALWHARAH